MKNNHMKGYSMSFAIKVMSSYYTMSSYYIIIRTAKIRSARADKNTEQQALNTQC